MNPFTPPNRTPDLQSGPSEDRPGNAPPTVPERTAHQPLVPTSADEQPAESVIAVDSTVNREPIHRRRHTVRDAVVTAALLVTSAVAVSELVQARSSDPVVRMSQPTTAPDAMAAAADGSQPAAKASAGVPAYDDDGRLVIADAVPAELSDPHMQWVAVPADSPQALAARFDTSQRYALATAPDEPGPNRLFENQDGTWIERAFEVPNHLRSMVVSGDHIYAVGTAPAVAGGAGGTLGIYDPSKTAWDLTSLPEHAQPYSSERVSSSVDLSIAPIDGGILVAVSSSGGYLNYDAFPELSERTGVYGYLDWSPDGTVVSYQNCDDAAIEAIVTDTTALSATTSPPATGTDSDVDSSTSEHCDKRVYQPGELGLTDADQRALSAGEQFSLWRIVDGERTEVGSPQPDATGGSIRGRSLEVWTDSSWSQYHIAADGSFDSLFPDVPTQPCVGSDADPIGCYMGFGFAAGKSAFSSVDRYLVRDDVASGRVTTTDLEPLFSTIGANADTWISGVGAIGDVFVGVAGVEYDPPSVDPAGFSASSSGFTLRATDRDFEVIDDSTGDPADIYDLSTESGKVDVWVGPSTEPGSTAVVIDGVGTDDGEPPSGEKVTFDVDWRTVPGLASEYRDSFFTTVDGIHVSVVDPIQIAGLPADADYWVGYPVVTPTQVSVEIYQGDDSVLTLIGTPLQ